jgi:hypothetical protein
MCSSDRHLSDKNKRVWHSLLINGESSERAYSARSRNSVCEWIFCKEHDPGISRLQQPTGTLLVVCELFIRDHYTFMRIRVRESQIECMTFSEPEKPYEVSSVATLINFAISLFSHVFSQYFEQHASYSEWTWFSCRPGDLLSWVRISSFPIVPPLKFSERGRRSEIKGKTRVFRRDSPPTRSRRSTGGGGESSSMLTSVEGNAVQGRMLL